MTPLAPPPVTRNVTLCMAPQGGWPGGWGSRWGIPCWHGYQEKMLNMQKPSFGHLELKRTVPEEACLGWILRYVNCSFNFKKLFLNSFPQDHCYEVSDELYFEGLFLSLAGIKPSLMTSEDSTPLASTASSSLPSPVSTPPHSVALSLRLPHSYMLLRANEMYKRGALMEEDIYDFFGYHGHSHLWDVEESDINVAVTGRKRTLGPNYSV